MCEVKATFRNICSDRFSFTSPYYMVASSALIGGHGHSAAFYFPVLFHAPYFDPRRTSCTVCAATTRWVFRSAAPATVRSRSEWSRRSAKTGTSRSVHRTVALAAGGEKVQPSGVLGAQSQRQHVSSFNMLPGIGSLFLHHNSQVPDTLSQVLRYDRPTTPCSYSVCR